MPFKCSVKGCNSNYDSTKEKVPVFKLPSDPEQKAKWLQNLKIKETKFSRVCSKHFHSSEFGSSLKRTFLKAGAVPFGDGIDKVEEVEEYEAEDLVYGFEDFCAKLDEFLQNSVADWNVYVHSDGVCFYHLEPKDDFADVNLSLKIVIDKKMKIRLYKFDSEVYIDELKDTVSDGILKTWDQLTDIIGSFQHCSTALVNPDAETSSLLKKANEALRRIGDPELREQIDVIQEQIELLSGQVEPLFFTVHIVDRNEEFLDEEDEETISQDLETVGDDQMDCQQMDDDQEVYDDVIAEEFDEEIIQNESDEQEALEDPLKCHNCLITFKSDNGLMSHQKTCKTPIPNITTKEPNPKFLKFPQRPLKLKVYSQNPDTSNRIKCSHCNIFVLKSIYERHTISAHGIKRPGTHLW